MRQMEERMERPGGGKTTLPVSADKPERPVL